jgi:hypothetical protein
MTGLGWTFTQGARDNELPLLNPGERQASLFRLL